MTTSQEDTIAGLREHLKHSEESRGYHFQRAERYRQAIQEAGALLDFEAHLGPPEHQAVVGEVVRILTAALESGAMSLPFAPLRGDRCAQGEPQDGG